MRVRRICDANFYNAFTAVSNGRRKLFYGDLKCRFRPAGDSIMRRKLASVTTGGAEKAQSEF